MNVREFAKNLKTSIEKIKDGGTPAISCEDLIGYLEKVITSPQQDEIDRYNNQLEKHAEFNHQSNLEMFKSVIEFSKSAIQTSLILNGGAAVAILAFLGQIADKQPDKIPVLVASIVPFGIGAILVGLTSGTTYLTQWFYSDEKTEKVGYGFNIVGILFGLSSYFAFAWGVLQTYCTIGRAF